MELSFTERKAVSRVDFGDKDQEFSLGCVMCVTSNEGVDLECG